MEALRDPGTLWLTRASDIIDHLVYAAATERPVTLSGAGFAVRGTFAAPEGGWALFVPDTSVTIPFPRIAAAVRADYQGDADVYCFYSKLMSVDARGRWVLQAPVTVERNDRRIISRYNVAGISGFCFRVTEWSTQPLLGVYDLSVAGLGIINDPRRLQLEPEQLIEGALHMPGEDPVPMCVEVRNSRDYPRKPGFKVVGARVTAIATVHQSRLAGYLAKLSKSGR
jgi:hypothetical protein